MTDAAARATDAAEALLQGRVSLGIELGSTRIKACLVLLDDPSVIVGVGDHAWENRFVDRTWTYDLDAVWTGLQSAYAALAADVDARHGVALSRVGALGVSAMMHGYLAFDAAGDLLVPFRTWRNTSTGRASEELTELLGQNIPLRWSIAHLHQAILDEEPHVGQVRFLTTLSGYVHWRLTGEKVLGVGDASGMFPIDSATGDFDDELIARYDRAAAGRVPTGGLRGILPVVRVAGADAGTLTAEGAALLDPTGTLAGGAVACPPEGDAGTGMVATDSVAPRTANVSAGTSIFAMVVLERALGGIHHEIDLVTTPAGDPVAMVHCNNGASELAAWVTMFVRFAAAAGQPVTADEAFDVLFREALAGDADAGGLIAYNHLAGEPIAGLDEGRPLFVRTPDSAFTLANAMRAQLYGVFGTLALGMKVLEDEGVGLDRMFAHGGVFRTAGVAQRFLAGALDVPVAVGETASEGGAWGIAVLAAYRASTIDSGADTPASLGDYLHESVFGDAAIVSIDPDPADVAGFAAYLDRYRAGLAVEAAAVASL